MKRKLKSRKPTKRRRAKPDTWKVDLLWDRTTTTNEVVAELGKQLRSMADAVDSLQRECALLRQRIARLAEVEAQVRTMIHNSPVNWKDAGGNLIKVYQPEPYPFGVKS